MQEDNCGDENADEATDDDVAPVMPVVLSSTDADVDAREEETEEKRAADRGAWERNRLFSVGQL